MTAPTAVQIRTLVAAELRTEARTGTTLWTTLPYAVGALLVVALAVGADIPLLRRIGLGTYWSVVLLFGSMACSRHGGTDLRAHRDMLLLLGVDPAVRFLSRTLASSVVVLAFATLLAPIAVILYDLTLTRPVAFGVSVVLVAAGIGTLGTLATDLTASAGASLTSVALMVTPLSVPLMLASVQVSQPTTTPSGVVAWWLLSLTAVLVFVAAGLLTARTLQEVPA